MATEKQILANRKNARKSTGPRTAIGRSRSSQNAVQHGLSQALPDGDSTALARTDLARALDLSLEIAGFSDFCVGSLEIWRVRKERARAISSVLEAIAAGKDFGRSPIRMERYERLARQKRRRGLRFFKQMGVLT